MEGVQREDAIKISIKIPQYHVRTDCVCGKHRSQCVAFVFPKHGFSDNRSERCLNLILCCEKEENVFPRNVSKSKRLVHNPVPTGSRPSYSFEESNTN
jgi:hypothetical protein